MEKDEELVSSKEVRDISSTIEVLCLVNGHCRTKLETDFPLSSSHAEFVSLILEQCAGKLTRYGAKQRTNRGMNKKRHMHTYTLVKRRPKKRNTIKKKNKERARNNEIGERSKLKSHVSRTRRFKPF